MERKYAGNNINDELKGTVNAIKSGESGTNILNNRNEKIHLNAQKPQSSFTDKAINSMDAQVSTKINNYQEQIALNTQQEPKQIASTPQSLQWLENFQSTVAPYVSLSPEEKQYYSSMAYDYQSKGLDSSVFAEQFLTANAIANATGLTRTEVNDNYDAISEYLLGSVAPISFTSGQSIINSWKIGQATQELSKLKDELRELYSLGMDETTPQVLDKINEINRIEETVNYYGQDATPNNFAVNALSTVVQQVPYILGGIVSGTAGGAIAAGLTGAVAAGLSLPATAAASVAWTAGSIISRFFKYFGDFRGQAFYNMKKEGVSTQTALKMSNYDGLVNGANEAALDAIFNGLAPKLSAGVVKKAFPAVASKLASKGIVQSAVSQVAINMLSNGTSEFIQEASESLTSAGFQAIAEYCDELQYSSSVKLSLQNAWKEGSAGFLVGVVLGIPGSITATQNDIKTAEKILDMAKTIPSKEAFVTNKDAVNLAESLELNGSKLSADAVKETLSAAYDNTEEARNIYFTEKIAETYKDQVFETEDIAKEEALIITDDEGKQINNPDGKVLRTNTGRIYSESTQLDDSHIQVVYGADENQIYGVINLSKNDEENELVIESVRTSLGYESLRSEMIKQAITDFRTNENIVWNPSTKGHLSVKDYLIENNPAGKEAGLNYSYSGNTEVLAETAKDIKTNIPNITTEESIIAAKFYMLAHPEGGAIFGNAEKDGVLIESQRGASSKARKLIYTSQRADVSTFVHELFHTTVDSDVDAKTNLAKAIKSTITNNKELTKFKEFLTNNSSIWGSSFNIDKILSNFSNLGKKWTIQQEEDITRLYEAYRASTASIRKFLPEQIRAILEKIAESIKSVYKTLKETVPLNKAIASAFDKITITDTFQDAENKPSVSRETSDADTMYQQAPPDYQPTKTGIGYKVFFLKNGKLYPPMVANPDGADTPTNVWLLADAGKLAGTTKTGRLQVKAGGKGTQGGSGTLAYRPGWHLGEIPYALQFNRLDPATGEKTLFPKNFVWAEVEYAMDQDYQEEAMSYGINKNGKFQHSLAGLPRIPENGYYRYRTNPNPATDPWIITGAMKVNKILTKKEVDSLVIQAGRKPQKVESSDILYQQAFHGSSHKFDKFSTSAIGSGAGSQAFGWGLYVTDDEIIAKGYSDLGLTPEQYDKEVAEAQKTYDNAKFFYNNALTAIKLLDRDPEKHLILNKTYQNLKSPEYKASLTDLQVEQYNKKFGNDWGKGYIYFFRNTVLEEQLKKTEERLKRAEVLLEKTKAQEIGHNIYTVNIPDEDYFIWDENQDEQAKRIHDAIIEYQKANKKFNDTEKENLKLWTYDATGYSTYAYISRMMGSDKQASLFLNKIGFKGIKYKSQQNITVPGANPSAYNYVIFDDDSIEILEHIMYQDEIDDWFDSLQYMDKESEQAPFYTDPDAIVDENNSDEEQDTEFNPLFDNPLDASSVTVDDPFNYNDEEEIDNTEYTTQELEEIKTKKVIPPKKEAVRMSELTDSEYFSNDSLNYTYERFLNIIKPQIKYAGTDADKDKQFVQAIKNLEDFGKYLSILGENVVLNTMRRNRINPLDIDPYEDQHARESIQEKVLSRVTNVSILRLAADLNTNTEVSMSRIKKAQKEILQYPRIWRDLFARISYDENMKPQSLIDSKKLTIPDGKVSTLTQNELIRLASEANAEEVVTKLQKGTLKLKDVDEQVLQNVSQTLNTLKKSIDEDKITVSNYDVQVKDLTAKIEDLEKSKKEIYHGLSFVEKMIDDAASVIGADGFDEDGKYKNLVYERSDLTNWFNYFLKINTPTDRRKHTPGNLRSFESIAKKQWFYNLQNKYNYDEEVNDKFVAQRLAEVEEEITELQLSYIKRYSLELFLKTQEVHQSAKEFKAKVIEQDTTLHDTLAQILDRTKKSANEDLKAMLSELGVDITDKTLKKMSAYDLMIKAKARAKEVTKKRVNYWKDKVISTNNSTKQIYKEEIDRLKTKLAIASKVADSKTNAMRTASMRIDSLKRKIEKTKEVYNQRIAEKRNLEKIRAEKEKLVRIIMKPVSINTTDWTTAGQIITAIQATVDPSFRRDWAKVIPDNPYSNMTKDEAVKYLESLEEGERADILSALSAQTVQRLFDGRKSMNEFTMQELQQLAMDVQNLKTEGRQVLTAKKKYKEIQAKEAIRSILDTLKPLTADADKSLYGSQERNKEDKTLRRRIQAGVYATRRMQELAQLLDGGYGNKGTAYSLLVDEKRYHKNRTEKAIDERMDKINNFVKSSELKKAIMSTYSISLGDIVQTYSAMDLAYVYLSQFNDDNMQAVAYGNLLTEQEKGTKYNSNNDNDDENIANKVVDRFLSKETIADDKVLINIGNTRYKKLLNQATQILNAQGLMPLINAISEDFSSQTDKLSKVITEVYNTPFNPVKNYLPIHRQALSGEDLYQDFADSMFNTNTNGIMNNPEKGWSIDRIKIAPRHQKPVSLNLLSVFEKAVTQQEILFENAAYIKKLHLILRNSELTETITKAYGKAMLNEVEDYVDLIANPSKGLPKTNTDKLLRMLRGNLGAAYLGFKSSGIILQALTSWAPFLSEMNPARLICSYLKIAASHSNIQKIFEKSTMMKHRSMNQIYQELLENMSTVSDSKIKKRLLTFQKVGMAGLEITDKIMVAGGWLAKYEEILNKSLKDGMSTSEAEITAIKSADDMVLRIQPIGDKTEMASMFRGDSEALKAILQFQSSLNVIWNNITANAAGFINTKNYKAVVGTYAGYAIAGLLVGSIMTGFDDNDDDSDKGSKIAYWAFSQFIEATPFIAASIDRLAEKLIIGEGSSYSSSNLFPAFDYFYQTLSSVQKKDFAEAFKKTLYGVGLLTGLPVSGLKQLERVQNVGPKALVGRLK